MRKVKRLWVGRDKGGYKGEVWFFNDEPKLSTGIFVVMGDAVSMKYLLFNKMFGVDIRPGQKKQIEIREVK